MPWTCPTCAVEVALDEGACPACGAVKLAWTVMRDRTRTMVLPGRRRFALLRGASTRSAPPDQSASVELLEAEQAVVLREAQARALAARGHLPATADLLFVALYPGKHPDLTVTVEALYAGRPGQPVELPRERVEGEQEPVLVPLLFLDAEEVPADLALPGVHLIAIGEEADPGFAPSVELAALGKPAQELPTARKALPRFAFSS